MSKYDALRAEACKANLEIAELKLAILTWGNASAFDPAAGVFAIKPSGLEYSELAPESMVIVDLEGKVVDTFRKHRCRWLWVPAFAGTTH